MATHSADSKIARLLAASGRPLTAPATLGDIKEAFEAMEDTDLDDVGTEGFGEPKEEVELDAGEGHVDGDEPTPAAHRGARKHGRGKR